MRATRITAAFAALAIVAAACGSTPGQEPTTQPPTSQPGSTISPTSPTTTTPSGFTPGSLVRLDLPRSDTPVTASDIASVVAGDRQFGLDLFDLLAADENFMLSPYSIATALSMAYPGARGDTADEIATVLHLSVDDATLHAVRSSIEAALASPPPPSGEEDTRAPFTIRPANSAWGQGGYPFLDDYLRVLAESYGAGLQIVDYVNDPEGSRTLINDWVEEATEDRIQDLIPPGAITDMTRLTLVNAIWFKANWAEPFDPDRTAPGPFTLLDGQTVEVPLMLDSKRTGYVETDLFQALRLPYAGEASMVILLPKEGTPAELAAQLTADDLDLVFGDFMVDITLPRFEFEADVALRAALQQLGMPTAFEPPTGDSGADFTGIVEPRDLYITDALHKTFIALDEQGTEAAAATALIFGVTSLPQPATFTADRPFLFWIEHTPTGEPLFLGQVVDPS